jgi:nitrite reductase/ring-hydroxylating ferredoxin subunit
VPDSVKLADVAEISPGTGRVVAARGRVLALFHVEGRFFAIDNSCPHRGGPLGEGVLEGRVVTCPWHGWEFDVTTGAGTRNPAACVRSVPVEIRDGAVYAFLD